MAQVLYNSVDITDDIEIALLNVTEDCGDTPDAIDMLVSNADSQWCAWQPKKGDTLEVRHEGYSSGIVTIDELQQDSGRITLSAISAPTSRKTRHIKSWENVTLITLASEIAAKYGLTVQFYGVETFSYRRVDQLSQGDFVFLAERCALEGCKMKISGNKLAVYSERLMEKAAPVKTITPDLFFDEPNFKSGAEVYRSCVVSSGGIVGIYEDANVTAGSQLTVSHYEVSSQGEAERFAKNLLRDRNKREQEGKFTTVLDTAITAGNTIAVAGMGLSDGIYFIENARHCFAEELSDFRVRKIFERY